MTIEVTTNVNPIANIEVSTTDPQNPTIGVDVPEAVVIGVDTTVLLGPKGDPGFSPIANVSKTGTTATITITDQVGTTTATVSDGAKGDTGDSGVRVQVDEPTDPDVNVWINPNGTDTPYLTDVKVDDVSVVTNRVANLGKLASKNVVNYVTEVINKPVIPTVNNGTLTIQKNGATVGTFSANQSTNSTVNIEADVQVNADWNATSGVAEILNKPNIPTKTSDLTNDSDFITTSYHDSTKYNASNPSGYQTSSQVNTAITSNIVNDVAHTDVNKSLSANMGKELQDQITNLKQRGRYLSVWNCTTGLATTEPTVNPYTYKAGDYFIVGFVGTTNYRPNGLTYDKDVASTTVETGSVHVNDTYYFDGTVWSLLATEQVAVAFSTLAGQPYDNSNLASALNSKANESALTSHTTNTSNPHSVTKAQVGLGNVDNTSDLNKPISTAMQNALNGKQATLTAGTNISISNNTISATDTTYSAGVGININNNVISTNAVINQNDTTQGLKDWCGTDNDYANISTKDADTLYFTFKQVGQILAEFTGYPLEITYAIAVALVGYKIYGNSSQTGTPTPSTPIEVTSVGDKTENLFNKVTMGTRIYAWIGSNGILAPASDSYSIEFACEGNTTYTLAIPQDVYSNLFRCGSSSSRYTGAELTLSNVVRNNPYAPITITTGANHKYIYIQFGTSTSATVLNNLVIVEGSTAPTSYIPYGYKVPINVNGTTQQTIYLTKPLAKVGTYADYIDYENQQVVRNVGVTTLSAGTHTLSDAVSNGTYLCTQQASGTLSGQSITLDIGVTNATVYYPLATPTTESVTLPEITMAEGTNTITTGTSLVPSNAYAKAYVSQE